MIFAILHLVSYQINEKDNTRQTNFSTKGTDTAGGHTTGASLTAGLHVYVNNIP